MLHQNPESEYIATAGKKASKEAESGGVINRSSQPELARESEIGKGGVLSLTGAPTAAKKPRMDLSWQKIPRTSQETIGNKHVAKTLKTWRQVARKWVKSNAHSPSTTPLAMTILRRAQVVSSV